MTLRSEAVSFLGTPTSKRGCKKLTLEHLELLEQMGSNRAQYYRTYNVSRSGGKACAIAVGCVTPLVRQSLDCRTSGIESIQTYFAEVGLARKAPKELTALIPALHQLVSSGRPWHT